jgi:hypothetical protein
MQVSPLAEMVAKELEAALKPLPDEFCATFEYTTTGNNLTHPIVLGELVAIVRRLPGVAHVGVDVHLNMPEKRIKFQPDVVAYADSALRKIALVVDYESPNSCDLRIIEKDIRAYRKWRLPTENNAPYIIVTTLPDAACKDWEVRWTVYEGYAKEVRDKKREVLANPFQFWVRQWRERTKPEELNGISILNIDRKQVLPVELHV